MDRSLRFLVLVAAVIFLGYWGMFGWMIYRSPVPYDAIDRNHDGSVSFTEADYVSSFGVHTIYHQGEKCVEYFAYKDGLPLKVDCPD